MSKVGIFISVITFLISFQIKGQDLSKKRVKKKLKEAKFLFDLRVYNKAELIYEEIKDSKHLPEPYLGYEMIGRCLLDSKIEKDKTIDYLEKATKMGSSDALFYLGQAYHNHHEFNKSLANFNLFKSSVSKSKALSFQVDHYKQMTETAIILISNPKEVEIINMGDKINSKYSEYGPVINADGSLLAFTSRRSGGFSDTLDFNKEYYEDVYLTHKHPYEGWLAPENLREVNSEAHDATVGMSADGNKLILYKSHEGSYGGDLYFSRLEASAWTTPTKFNNHINTKGAEPSASISPDGKTLYFTSDRPGGYGGRDIYKSVKNKHGEWGKATNLGNTINTAYDEDAPFIHYDGKTLYFSSKGHETMGGYDVLRSEIVEDNKWSTPENLGYPINSVDDDIYLVILPDGNTAYYSSDHAGGFGEKDIYKLIFDTKVEPVTVIKGNISGENDAKLDAEIQITVDGAAYEQVVFSNAATGKYIIVLPNEHHYDFTVKSIGYKEEKISFDFKGKGHKEMVTNFKMIKK